MVSLSVFRQLAFLACALGDEGERAPGYDFQSRRAEPMGGPRRTGGFLAVLHLGSVVRLSARARRIPRGLKGPGRVTVGPRHRSALHWNRYSNSFIVSTGSLYRDEKHSRRPRRYAFPVSLAQVSLSAITAVMHTEPSSRRRGQSLDRLKWRSKLFFGIFCFFFLSFLRLVIGFRWGGVETDGFSSGGL